MKLTSIFRKKVRAFTLLEVTISIAIMMVMTGLLLFNYPESAVRMTLINSVHSVALLVREAQVRGSAIDSSNATIGGYGVYIVMPVNNASVQSVAKLFGDSVSSTVNGTFSSVGLPIGNGLYETAPIDETKSVTSLPLGYKITKFCVGQGPATCFTQAGTTLTISFTRPSPRPDIYINGSKATNYSKACIELQSSRAPAVGHIRSVEVYNSGMIRTVITGCS